MENPIIPPKEFMDKLRADGNIPLGILYYREKDEKLVLAPTVEVGYEFAKILLGRWGLQGLVDGKGLQGSNIR